MTDLAAKIKTHGYWKVIIRPTRYVECRIENVMELYPLVQRLAVQLRGWDFPHIDSRSNAQIGSTWAGQEIEWKHHLERWRLYQSGQFTYLGGFTLDWATDTNNWLPQPPRFPRDVLLGITDVVCRFAEFFEFASALALSPIGDNSMFVEIGCYGIKERELWLDEPNRISFSFPQKASIPTYVQKLTFPRETLATEARRIGNRWAKELFRRFDWDPSDELLEEFRSLFR